MKKADIGEFYDQFQWTEPYENDWDDDWGYDDKQEYLPVYGPKTEAQQVYCDLLRTVAQPMFRFRQFQDVKELISKGDTIVFKR